LRKDAATSRGRHVAFKLAERRRFERHIPTSKRGRDEVRHSSDVRNEATPSEEAAYRLSASGVQGNIGVPIDV